MIYKKIALEKNAKVWFTSDTHYGHKNICKGVSDWDLNDHGGSLAVRDFDTLEDMNGALVSGINDYVGKDDYLVHLGDWSFGGEDNIKKFRDRVECNNIIFIIGNHDHHIANNKELFKTFGVYGDESTLRPFNAQDLFSSVHAYLELVVSSPQNGKSTYNLMHFPLAVWNKAHHNRIMLHGHCHANYQHLGKSLDVGVDMAFKMFGEYRPFSQEEVEIFAGKRNFVPMDHHNNKIADIFGGGYYTPMEEGEYGFVMGDYVPIEDLHPLDFISCFLKVEYLTREQIKQKYGK